MSDIAIKVENLSKSYLLGHNSNNPERYTALRDVIAHNVKSLARKTNDMLRGKTIIQGDEIEEFWALKNLSFEVRCGDRIGVIGRNGAGKSTLLKILSRITEPTTGRVLLNGRVASLLEVGTGFHPELTGRENIYLNGAILGMSRKEIQLKFDEIVSFAEIEKFIDTPVKRYSSGMYVRLAFAVAAHLESEILIIDEVLAVGDIQFQKKCLGKIEDVSSNGRTVIFVSHNMSTIRQLCNSAILFKNGELQNIGEANHIVENYLKSLDKSNGESEIFFEEDYNKEFQVLNAKLLNSAGQITGAFTCDESITIEMACKVRRKIPGLYGYLTLTTTQGETLLESDSFDIKPNNLDDLNIGFHILKISIPKRTLGAGDYFVYCNFTSPSGIRGFNIDTPGNILSFRLDDPNTQRGNNRNGRLSTLLRWEMKSKNITN